VGWYNAWSMQASAWSMSSFSPAGTTASCTVFLPSLVNYPGRLSPSIMLPVSTAALHSAYRNAQKVKFSITVISLERSFRLAPTMSIITRVQCTSQYLINSAR